MIKVNIEKLVYGGKGLGKIDDRVCFVPFVLPEEEVSVKITNEKKSFIECQPVEILKSSPYRVEPVCKYFTYCGGCDYMHIQYEKQVEYKKEIFLETLERIGKIKDIPLQNVFPSENPFHYRNRVQFKIYGEKVGFYQRESHNVINIDYCYLLKEELNQALAGLREVLPFLTFQPVEAHFYSSSEGQMTVRFIFPRRVKSFPLGLKHLKAFLGETLVGAGIYQKDKIPKRINFIGSPFGYETVGGYRFRVSADSFFQINRFQVKNMIQIVEEEAKNSDVSVAFDLYSGVGTFTIPMGRYIEKVFGVEINPYAVQDANHNKKLNKTPNVHFHRAPASQVLNYMKKKNPQLVLVDPPRTGLDKDTLNAILELPQLKKLIYISCNPSTLARDINKLVENGFQLTKTYMIDMFPQTYHIESITILERKPMIINK